MAKKNYEVRLEGSFNVCITVPTYSPEKAFEIAKEIMCDDFEFNYNDKTIDSVGELKIRGRSVSEV